MCVHEKRENREPEYSHLATLFPHLFFLCSPSFLYRRYFLLFVFPSRQDFLYIITSFLIKKIFPLTPRTAVAVAAAASKSLQSCPTLCDPRDGSSPGSPIPGILQARTLEWVAISFSSAWKWKVKVKSLSHVRLLANPWTAAYQLPPSKGFSRQGYWSGLPLPSLTPCTSCNIWWL